MGIDAGQLRDLITRVLQEMGLYSPAATELLMLTAATESHLGTYLRQLGGGPALGVFQMEPATHDDAWINWMPYHVKISMQASNVSQSAAIRRQRLIKGSMPDGNATELEWNLAYAVFMARVHYRRFPEPLPPLVGHGGPGQVLETVLEHQGGRRYSLARRGGLSAPGPAHRGGLRMSEKCPHCGLELPDRDPDIIRGLDKIARYLGVSKDVARAMIQTRELRLKKVARAWTATKAQLQQYVEDVPEKAGQAS